MDAYYKENHILFFNHGLHIGFPRWPIIVCVMESAVPQIYNCYNISCRHSLFELSTKKEDMLLGTMISILDFQNGHLLWLILRIGNFLRYNKDIMYISLSKVQWCVHGHRIHMQWSYEVNVLITSKLWFDPACSIYVKILWWHSCPKLCLLSDNSDISFGYIITIYSFHVIFLP